MKSISKKSEKTDSKRHKIQETKKSKNIRITKDIRSRKRYQEEKKDGYGLWKMCERNL